MKAIGAGRFPYQIADFPSPKHPDHRPPYLGTIPLVEMIRALKGVKSTRAKSVIKIYDTLIEKFGSEFSILTEDSVLSKIRMEGEIYRSIANLRNAL